MSKKLKRVIKKRSQKYKITRYDRKSGYYDEEDGIWVDAIDENEYLLMHIQPVTDQLNDGVPAQRQLISWHGWAIDNEGNGVSNKDILTIDDGLFTVSDMIYWPGIYREFDLTRSGEADNLDDS